MTTSKTPKLQNTMTEAYERAQAFAKQYAAFEAKFAIRAQGAVANLAQRANKAIDNGIKHSAQARKRGLALVKPGVAG